MTMITKVFSVICCNNNQGILPQIVQVQGPQISGARHGDVLLFFSYLRLSKAKLDSLHGQSLEGKNL